MTVFFDAESRPVLGPPSIQLKTEISNIAQVLLESKSEHELVFKLQKDIYNKASKQIIIRTTEQISDALAVDKSYIIGYIAWQVNRPSKEVVPRDGGSVLMSLPGAEPAIFKDVPEIVDILSVDVDKSITSPESLLPIINAGIASDDFQTMNFFVTELITRKSLLSKPSSYKVVKNLILNAKVDWRIKYFILANEGLNESQLKSAWFEQWATAILINSSTQFDENGSEAALIVQLLKKSDYYLHADQVNVLTRWINSNHSGVIESMLDALKMLQLDEAIKIVNIRLQQALLDQRIKITLTNYLLRLENQKKQQSDG